MGLIALFDDFGTDGPYVGQVKAAIERERPGTVVIDLQHDAPAFDPRASAYLLAAVAKQMPPETVFLAVVDPGVGTERKAAAVRADGRWFVGPDNGLFGVVARRSEAVEWWEITWRPDRLSSTFHGRDLFAPVAACLASGERPIGLQASAPDRVHQDCTDSLDEIIYIDHYGNAMTGRFGDAVETQDRLYVGPVAVTSAGTFGDHPLGEPFWYVNSTGLVEIAANKDSAARLLGLGIGDACRMDTP